MTDFDSLTKGLDPQEVKDFINKTTIDYFGGMTKMAKYAGKQSVLDEVLGEFKDFGFSLVEPDDHLLELWFKDKRIATYYQTKATIEIIQEGCRNFLANITDPAYFAKKLQQDYQDTYGEELRRNG